MPTIPPPPPHGRIPPVSLTWLEDCFRVIEERMANSDERMDHINERLDLLVGRLTRLDRQGTRRSDNEVVERFSAIIREAAASAETSVNVTEEEVLAILRLYRGRALSEERVQRIMGFLGDMYLEQTTTRTAPVPDEEET